MRGAAQGTTRVESRYTIQTCDPSVSRTAVRWGPQFFFERPAQIPRSFLRSFSLWATPVPLAPFDCLKMKIHNFISIETSRIRPTTGAQYNIMSAPHVLEPME